MGTGWNYFNNVCQALRVAIGVAGVAFGLLLLVGGWWGVSQYWQTTHPEEMQATPAPAGEGTDPSVSNASAVSNAAAPTTSAVQNAASAAPSGARSNAAPPAAASAAPSAVPVGKSAASASSRPDFYHSAAKPNPQFSGVH